MSVDNELEDQPISVLLDDSLESRPSQGLSVSPFRYLNRGKYVEFLDIYSDLFDREQLKILIYEDFVGNPEEVRRLFKSLRISDFDPPSLFSKINSGDYIEPGAPPDVICRLNEYFAPWNQELESRFGCDVSYWRKCTTTA